MILLLSAGKFLVGAFGRDGAAHQVSGIRRPASSFRLVWSQVGVIGISEFFGVACGTIKRRHRTAQVMTGIDLPALGETFDRKRQRLRLLGELFEPHANGRVILAVLTRTLLWSACTSPRAFDSASVVVFMLLRYRGLRRGGSE
jgi:hypothetical protein